MQLNKFFEIANERNRIYTLKEFGMPKPWTEDPIFLDSYFCNVFRDQDKVSKWIIENLIHPYASHPQLWASIIMCRMLSRIETLQILKDNDCLIGDYKKAYSILRGMQERKESIFTGAFIINSKTSTGWTDKVTYLFNTLTYFNKLRFEVIDEDELPVTMNIHEWIQEQNSLYTVWKMFKEAPGIADFMAYQYTCDLTYSVYLKDNVDEQHWTKLGLGAVRGMNRLLKGYATKDKIPDEINKVRHLLNQWNNWGDNNLSKEIKKTWKMIREVYPKTTYKSVILCYEGFDNLKMQDVQHWLCEYDKHCRGGSSKRKYSGRR